LEKNWRARTGRKRMLKVEEFESERHVGFVDGCGELHGDR
jgi:hypothetical protein